MCGTPTPDTWATSRSKAALDSYFNEVAPGDTLVIVDSIAGQNGAPTVRITAFRDWNGRVLNTDYGMHFLEGAVAWRTSTREVVTSRSNAMDETLHTVIVRLP